MTAKSGCETHQKRACFIGFPSGSSRQGPTGGVPPADRGTFFYTRFAT